MRENGQNPLVKALLDPNAYPDRPAEVVLVETHISHLFFTGRYVYKVKKPVDFGFLDFTTLEKRRFFCQQEVELNRRLAPQVYLGVVEVREQDGSYTVEGPGTTVEYAVKMRQLPRERSMAILLERGRLSPAMVEQVAQHIARFHQAAATDAEIARLGGLETVRQNVRENFDQTAKYIGVSLPRQVYADLQAYSEAFLEVRAPLLEQRAREGWVRNCHGDLHTAQVFLDDGVQVIDCIEFNQRFRYSDVVADIAFLAMDLDYHGRPDLSQTLIETYQAMTKDPGLGGLLDFYKVYRAYVRGKVESFRLDDPALSSEEREQVSERAQRYFRLAASYLQMLRPLTLYIMVGLMGTGKTQVAEALASHWELPVISSDVVRKELAGIPAMEHRYEEFGRGLYAEEVSQRTYEELFRRAGGLLHQRRSVILDASFRKEALRREAQRVAQAAGAEPWLIECTASEPAIRKRLEQRLRESGITSDGRWEIFRQQRMAFEPVEASPAQGHLLLDTSGPPEETAFRLLKSLYAGILQQGDQS